MKERGFTLIELMVTLVVAGILIMISYPSMTRFFNDNKLAAQAGDMQSMLATARHHALSYQAPVVICPLNSGKCSGSWQNAISAFVDTDGNGEQSAGEELLLVQEAVSNKRSFGAASIRYAQDGTLLSGAGTLEICQGTDNSLYHGVIVTLSGRSRLAMDSDKDGVKEDGSGAAIDCA